MDKTFLIPTVGYGKGHIFVNGQRLIEFTEYTYNENSNYLELPTSEAMVPYEGVMIGKKPELTIANAVLTQEYFATIQGSTVTAGGIGMIERETVTINTTTKTVTIAHSVTQIWESGQYSISMKMRSGGEWKFMSQMSAGTSQTALATGQFAVSTSSATTIYVSDSDLSNAVNAGPYLYEVTTGYTVTLDAYDEPTSSMSIMFMHKGRRYASTVGNVAMCTVFPRCIPKTGVSFSLKPDAWIEPQTTTFQIVTDSTHATNPYNYGQFRTG